MLQLGETVQLVDGLLEGNLRLHPNVNAVQAARIIQAYRNCIGVSGHVTRRIGIETDYPSYHVLFSNGRKLSVKEREVKILTGKYDLRSKVRLRSDIPFDTALQHGILRVRANSDLDLAYDLRGKTGVMERYVPSQFGPVYVVKFIINKSTHHVVCEEAWLIGHSKNEVSIIEED